MKNIFFHIFNFITISLFGQIDCAIVSSEGDTIFMQSTNLSVNNGNFTIGDFGPAGGTIFYDKGNNNDGWRYLESAPFDIGQYQWGCNNLLINDAGGISIGTGLNNTINTAQQCNDTNIAAYKCLQLNINGYDDWFLPSRGELYEMYINRSIIGGFLVANYWSSTQQPEPVPLPDYAYYQSFEDNPICCNGQYNTSKNNVFNVRACRKVSEANIEWSTGDSTSSITVTPNATTTYFVNVTFDNITCTDSITIYVEEPLINDKLLNLFAIYPNPVSDSFTIETNQNSNSINEIRIYDMNYKLIRNYVNTNKSNSLNINNHELKSGVYILEIQTNQNQSRKRLVIK